jgi:putative addiction module CopG family antidote
MTIALKPDVEKVVEQMVRCGEYGSADEAVNELLASMLRQPGESAEEISELRALVDEGIAELDRGEFAEFTAADIIAEGHAAHQARKQGT